MTSLNPFYDVGGIAENYLFADLLRMILKTSVGMLRAPPPAATKPPVLAEVTGMDEPWQGAAFQLGKGIRFRDSFWISEIQ